MITYIHNKAPHIVHSNEINYKNLLDQSFKHVLETGSEIEQKRCVEYFKIILSTTGVDEHYIKSFGTMCTQNSKTQYSSELKSVVCEFIKLFNKAIYPTIPRKPSYFF
jgi:hypothetical protein